MNILLELISLRILRKIVTVKKNILTFDIVIVDFCTVFISECQAPIFIVGFVYNCQG